jgi:dynein heavy chain, axonemal
VLVLRRVVEACCKKAEELTGLMPLVAALRMPGMRQRHWSLVTSVAQMDISRDRMNLHELLAQGIHQHMDVISEVAADAAQELVVENAVDHAATQLNSLLFDLGQLAETGQHPAFLWMRHDPDICACLNPQCLI